MRSSAPASAALLCAALGSTSAQAYTPDFGSSAAEPLIACTSASGVCSTFSRLRQSYGDVAGVVHVTTRSADGQALTWWNDNYNGLYGVVFNNDYSVAAPASVNLVPLAPGTAVNLSHFGMGGYLGRRNDGSVKVIDIGTGAELFSYLGDIGTQFTAGNWGQHTSFDVALSSFSGLRIQWADLSVARNTAIDNITFTVGAPVPEPASGMLLLAGLEGVGWLSRRRGGLAAAGLGLTLLGSGAAHAAPAAYPLTVMPALPGASLLPWVEAVNASGAVVGRSDVGSDVLATVWTPGMPARDLGGLPANQRWSMATGINDLGTVVGYSANGDTGTHGFRWSVIGGTMVDLSSGIGGGYSSAFGINNQGQVVGTANATGGRVAAPWQADGSFSNLGHYARAGSTPGTSQASDISDSGFVVGGTFYNGSPNQEWRWSTQQGKVALPNLPGAGLYIAHAVNAHGWAVGQTYIGTTSTDVRALLWNAAREVIALQNDDFFSVQRWTSTAPALWWGVATATAAGARSSGQPKPAWSTPPAWW